MSPAQLLPAGILATKLRRSLAMRIFLLVAATGILIMMHVLRFTGNRNSQVLVSCVIAIFAILSMVIAIIQHQSILYRGQLKALYRKVRQYRHAMASSLTNAMLVAEATHSPPTIEAITNTTTLHNSQKFND